MANILYCGDYGIKFMTREQASDYVCEHGRYMGDAPRNKYFVRFPGPYSSQVFMSDDTGELADKVFNAGRFMKWPLK